MKMVTFFFGFIPIKNLPPSSFFLQMLASHGHSVDESRESLVKPSFEGPMISTSGAQSDGQYSTSKSIKVQSVTDFISHYIIYLFISHDTITKQTLKLFMLQSLFPVELLIFLSSLIPDPQFNSISAADASISLTALEFCCSLGCSLLRNCFSST